MNITGLFIRRPIMTTLVMAGILMFGIMSYRLLPVSDLPNVDFPVILVNANLPGASPETMASSVATPLEKQFSTIAGIDSMNSSSSLGQTTITLTFSLDRTVDAAAQDVQAAIARTAPLLPPGMPTPPTYQKVNPADQPVIYLSVSSPTLPLSLVDEYAETLIAQRLSMLPGVAQVQIFGSQKYAVRAQVNPDALASLGIGLDEVANAIQNINVNLPTGTLYGHHKAYTVMANGQLSDANAYRTAIVGYKDGAPIRAEQLGRVIDSVQNDKVASWYGNIRAVVLAVQRQPGTNTVEVAKSIKALIPQFKSQIPASVDLSVLYDRSVPIEDSVRDVKFTLFLAVCLVVLVIFLFLRNVSATIIPALALPMSIIGTFAVMYKLGYTLDNLSLMALTLCVGFVVDDAIVMLENIVRHAEMGKSIQQAAFDGAKEIGFTIVSMTLSLAAAFIPVLFMGGILGRLLHEFAVTIGAAILVSGFVSLSLTPMLSSRFLRHQHSEERFFDRMLKLYERTLKIVLRHRLATLLISIALVFVTGFLFVLVPKGFLPTPDTGQIFAFTEAAQGISFESMITHQRRVAEIIRQDPNIENFMSFVGASGPGSAMNTGRIFMRLKPRSKRNLTADQIIQELRPKLAAVPGIRVFMQNLPPIRIGGMLTKSQYQYTVLGPDSAILYPSAQALESKMRNLPELMDVTSDLQIANPEVDVEIDRDKAAQVGVTPGQIENALYTAYGSRQISTIYTPSNEYWVILELLPQYQLNPELLSKLYIRSSNGSLVPLSTVSRTKESVGPLTVNHAGQFPSVTISFNLKPGQSLGQAESAISTLARGVLPGRVTAGFQGNAQAFQSSMQGLLILVAAAVLVIYIVLGILYESFIHPITILSSLPSAGIGALLTLLLFRMDLDVYGFVGIIMLIGIVKKNGIMMIDFALDAERKENKSPEEAIFQGCLIRFRPIMMTTFAALMGTLPIALGFGAGSEARRPLGMAVVGGLLVSQLLTLYITPVIYLYMEALRKKFSLAKKGVRCTHEES